MNQRQKARSKLKDCFILRYLLLYYRHFSNDFTLHCSDSSCMSYTSRFALEDRVFKTTCNGLGRNVNYQIILQPME